MYGRQIVIQQVNLAAVCVPYTYDKDGNETAGCTRGDELLSMEKDGRIWLSTNTRYSQDFWGGINEY